MGIIKKGGFDLKILFIFKGSVRILVSLISSVIISIFRSIKYIII